MFAKLSYQFSVVVITAFLMNALTASITNATNEAIPSLLDCTQDSPGSPLQELRMIADLNADGEPDYLLARPPCGNAGCHFAVFLSVDGKYRQTDFVFFHPKAVRLQTPEKEPAILQTYSRKNSTEGILVTYQISNAGVIEKATEPMKPAGRDGDRYDELFKSGNSPLVERGTCQGSTIAWEPY